MPIFTSHQPATRWGTVSSQPENAFAWWAKPSPTIDWSPISFDTNTWVVGLPDGRTLTFRSTSGFSPLRFPSETPVGVVDSIELRSGSTLIASVTELSPLNLSPADIAADELRVTAGDDRFVGSAGADIFEGGAGADQLEGAGGADSLVGAAGNDTLSGGDGGDTITDFDGDNLLRGDEGADSISGYGSIFGGGGNDTIRGGSGALHGEAGNDLIDLFFDGAAFGGDGDDQIVVSAGRATVDGGAGDDTLVVTYHQGPLSATQVGDVQISGVERLVIYAMGDLDASQLGFGLEAINGFNTGFNLRFGSASDNRIVGSSFADTISGGEGADTIAGGAGDDVLNGGDQGWGSYTMPHFTIGPRTVVLEAKYDLVDYSGAASGVTVDLNVKTAQNTGAGLDTLRGFEGILGSAFNDVLVGAPGDLRVSSYYGWGDAGPGLASRLYGNGGDDLLIGSTQGDTLSGGVGADTLEGGEGGDRLQGDGGADDLTGGGGGDIFSIAVDGAVDRIRDFSVADGDLLELTDADGEILDARAGLLIWDQAAGRLLWDADGAGAAQPAVVIASMTGAGALTRGHLALGFQPGALRTIAADGTVTDLALDWSTPELLIGTEDADTLVGAGAADTLQAGAGDDALDGRLGADVLTGGPGADKFLLTLDGAVDRITDFSLAEGDFLLLVDNPTTITDGSSGILIWDQAAARLSWDTDSDAGPQVPATIAEMSGTGMLTRANLAAGFQPSAIRVLRTDGSRDEMVFDWGGQSFDFTLTHFTHTGRPETYETWFDDGSYSISFWDVGPTAQAWDRRVLDQDAQGRQTAYAVHYDDGSYEVFRFDTLGQHSWQRLVERYDALGRLEKQGIVWDDGTAAERYIDTYDTQIWDFYIDNYDAAGRLLNHTFYRDDGTIVG